MPILLGKKKERHIISFRTLPPYVATMFLHIIGFETRRGRCDLFQCRVCGWKGKMRVASCALPTDYNIPLLITEGGGSNLQGT
jgi:hypothetical protein